MARFYYKTTITTKLKRLYIKNNNVIHIINYNIYIIYFLFIIIIFCSKCSKCSKGVKSLYITVGYNLLQRFQFYYVYYVIFEFDRDYMYTYNVAKEFKNERIYRMLREDLKRLVLTRREGETLLIADDRVQYIGMSAAGTALVLINSERVQLEVNYSYPFKNYYLRLMSSPYADKKPKIKIAIIAPPSVIVLRKELLGRRRRV